jgi:hypothetical protein
MTVVPIHDPDSSVQLDDIADALDRQIDLMWALIASLQTIQSEHPDPYTKSAPVLADAILDGCPLSSAIWVSSDSQARRIAANIAKLPELLGQHKS